MITSSLIDLVLDYDDLRHGGGVGVSVLPCGEGGGSGGPLFPHIYKALIVVYNKARVLKVSGMASGSFLRPLLQASVEMEGYASPMRESFALTVVRQLKTLEKSAKLFSRPHPAPRKTASSSSSSSSSSAAAAAAAASPPPRASAAPSPRCSSGMGGGGGVGEVGIGLTVLAAAVKSSRPQLVSAVLDAGDHLLAVGDSNALSMQPLHHACAPPSGASPQARVTLWRWGGPGKGGGERKCEGGTREGAGGEGVALVGIKGGGSSMFWCGGVRWACAVWRSAECGEGGGEGQGGEGGWEVAVLCLEAPSLFLDASCGVYVCGVCVCVCVCARARARSGVCVCVCVCTHTHICVHTYTYKYMHRSCVGGGSPSGTQGSGGGGCWGGVFANSDRDSHI
jgi:hypothetical protein